MANNYIEQFRSSLPQNQGNQILKLLTTKKDSGEIRTIDEFKTQLQDLTNKLLQSQSAPTLKLFRAITGKIISAEQFDDMLERIQDDLSAAFSEADTFESISSDHYQLINNVALKSIRLGLNKLESQISLYEFLGRDTNGFDNARYEKFNSSDISQVSRSDKAAASVYIDPKSLDLVPSSENASIDVLGDELFIGLQTGGDVFITQATWLSNGNSLPGEVDATFKKSVISNVIDGTEDTFWIVPLLFKAPLIGGAPMEISLSLGTAQPVNYLRIKPASLYPMELEQIDYIDSLGVRKTAYSSAIEIRSSARVDFPTVITSTLILRFRQYNYEEVQFVRQVSSNEYSLAVEGYSSDSPSVSSLSDSLRQTLSSDFILKDVYHVQDAISQGQKYIEYILGFDNIFVGYGSYNERGIFAAEKMKVSAPGQIALRIKEYRPAQIVGSSTIALQEFKYPTRSGVNDSIFYHGSLEYWIEAQLFTADNLLAATYTFPILPLHASRIYHERLIPTVASTGSLLVNEGQLAFYTLASGTDVLVYKNGLPLTYSTDWEFVSIADTSGLTIESPGTGKPMKRGIKINGLASLSDIYTVSYTPTLSNTRNLPSTVTTQTIVDLSGNNGIRLVTGNIAVFDKDQLPFDVAYANFYLITLLRRNSSLEELSPSLDEYLLLTSSIDEQKFAGI